MVMLAYPLVYFGNQLIHERKFDKKRKYVALLSMKNK